MSGIQRREFDWITAACLLLFVGSLARLLWALDAPWYVTALLWIFAAKWVLILVFDLPVP